MRRSSEKPRARPEQFLYPLGLVFAEYQANTEYPSRVVAPLRALAAGYPLADALAYPRWARAFSSFGRRHPT